MHLPLAARDGGTVGTKAVAADTCCCRCCPSCVRCSAIRLWDCHKAKCLKTYQDHKNEKFCIANDFSLTGPSQYIVAGSEDFLVFLWDLQVRAAGYGLEHARGAPSALVLPQLSPPHPPHPIPRVA